MSTTVRHSVRPATEDASVTPLELFFDLVFVYALTQVTSLMADHPSGEGVLHGMIVLALFWWCWVAYSWLGNTVQADEGLTRATFFLVMAVMFVASLVIPESFDDLPRGPRRVRWSSPSATPSCASRTSACTCWRPRATSGLARQLGMFAPVAFVSHRAGDRGRARGEGAGRWACGSSRCRRLRRYPGIGAGVAAALGRALRRALRADRDRRAGRVDRGDRRRRGDGPLDATVIAVELCSRSPPRCGGPTSTSSRPSRSACSPSRGAHRARLARDSYGYLHLPMIAGIVLAALGPQEGAGLRGR